MICVDDVLYASAEEQQLIRFEKYLKRTFKIKVTDTVTKYVGFEVRERQRDMTVHCKSYITALCKKFELLHAKKRYTPAVKGMLIEDEYSPILPDRTKFLSILGGLSYITNVARPDVAYVTNYLARCSAQPRMNQLKLAKRVLTYLYTTRNWGLKYDRKRPEKKLRVHAYCDADWASEKVDRKSITGYVVYVDDCVVTYKSKKQPVVAQSSFEAEFIALCHTATTLKFVKNVLTFLGYRLKLPMVIYADNQTAIRAFKARQPTIKSKHIDVRFHKMKNAIKKREMRIKYTSTDKNVADLLTKVPHGGQFGRLVQELVRE